MNIFITGMAGFIGFHMARALHARGHAVSGIDNLSAAGHQPLQHLRLAALPASVAFSELDVRDTKALTELITRQHPDIILHFAGHAGIRSAEATPLTSADVNILGHLSLLEAACAGAPNLSHIIYASSSSVYGDGTPLPFQENAHQPGYSSLYAATKSAAEAISSAYAQNYGLRQLGLRLFTVYGKYGRPDMAYWLFAEQILRGEPVRLFNHGQMRRDMTHIEDVTRCICAMVEDAPVFATPARPHEAFNIGTGRSYELGELVDGLETHLAKTAKREKIAKPPFDVTDTLADMTAFKTRYGFAPQITLEEGLPDFTAWLTDYLSGALSKGQQG